MLLQHSCTSRSRAHDGSAKAKKQKTKKTDETLLTVSRNWSAAMSAGFPLTLRVFHVGHPWTPFPVFLPEHVALKHAILSVQVILRTGNGNSDCVCVCAAWGGWVRGGGGGGGVKQDMLGITQSTKSVTWSEAKGWFIWLQKESVACGLEERMFSFFALSVLRHNTWKHFLRGHGSVKKKELQTFYFFSLFS